MLNPPLSNAARLGQRGRLFDIGKLALVRCGSTARNAIICPDAVISPRQGMTDAFTPCVVNSLSPKKCVCRQGSQLSMVAMY